LSLEISVASLYGGRQETIKDITINIYEPFG
jgi:hypothetical protein